MLIIRPSFKYVGNYVIYDTEEKDYIRDYLKSVVGFNKRSAFMLRRILRSKSEKSLIRGRL